MVKFFSLSVLLFYSSHLLAIKPILPISDLKKTHTKSFQLNTKLGGSTSSFPIKKSYILSFILEFEVPDSSFSSPLDHSKNFTNWLIQAGGGYASWEHIQWPKKKKFMKQSSHFILLIGARYRISYFTISLTAGGLIVPRIKKWIRPMVSLSPGWKIANTVHIELNALLFAPLVTTPIPGPILLPMLSVGIPLK